jgi:hypothetical protein
VNIVKRNMMSLEDYCVQFEKIGEETFKMTTSTTLKKIELTFKLDDKEIEEKTDDGRTVLVIANPKSLFIFFSNLNHNL